MGMWHVQIPLITKIKTILWYMCVLPFIKGERWGSGEMDQWLRGTEFGSRYPLQVTPVWEIRHPPLPLLVLHKPTHRHTHLIKNKNVKKDVFILRWKMDMFIYFWIKKNLGWIFYIKNILASSMFLELISIFIFRAGNLAQLVECLPTVHEVLCLTPAIAKTRCGGMYL